MARRQSGYLRVLWYPGRSLRVRGRPSPPRIPGAVCEFEGACDKDEKTGTCKPEGVAVELCDAIIRILDYLAYMGVDVEAVLMAKHEYNKGREYRHGGKRA